MQPRLKGTTIEEMVRCMQEIGDSTGFAITILDRTSPEDIGGPPPEGMVVEDLKVEGPRAPLTYDRHTLRIIAEQTARDRYYLMTTGWGHVFVRFRNQNSFKPLPFFLKNANVEDYNPCEKFYLALIAYPGLMAAYEMYKLWHDSPAVTITLVVVETGWLVRIERMRNFLNEEEHEAALFAIKNNYIHMMYVASNGKRQYMVIDRPDLKTILQIRREHPQVTVPLPPIGVRQVPGLSNFDVVKMQCLPDWKLTKLAFDSLCLMLHTDPIPKSNRGPPVPPIVPTETAARRPTGKPRCR